MKKTLKQLPRNAVQECTSDKARRWRNFLFPLKYTGKVMVRLSFKRQPSLSTLHQVLLKGRHSLQREHSGQEGQVIAKNVSIMPILGTTDLHCELTFIKCDHPVTHGCQADGQSLSNHVFTCKLVCPLVAAACIILCFYANQVHMKFMS